MATLPPPLDKAPRTLLERTIDRTIDRIADSIGAAIGAGLVAIAAFAMAALYRHSLWAIFFFGLLFGAAICLILVWIIRQTRLPRYASDKANTKWKLLDKPIAERRLVEYSATARFNADETPARWEISKTLLCISEQTALDNIADYITYDGGMDDVLIRPISAQNAAKTIKILDPRRVDNHRYEFLVNFLPPIQPDEIRTFKYSLTPQNPGPAKPYLYVGSRQPSHTGAYTFRVEFDPQKLPVDHVVRKVYWPNGKSENWTDYEEIDVAQVKASENWEIAFEFSEAEIRALDEQFKANPMQHSYGIVWEWS